MLQEAALPIALYGFQVAQHVERRERKLRRLDGGGRRVVRKQQRVQVLADDVNEAAVRSRKNVSDQVRKEELGKFWL